MNLSNSQSTLSLDPQAVAWLRDRFLEELHKAAEPIARYTGMAMAYLSGSDTQWITTSEGCPCSLDPEMAIRCLSNGQVASRHRQLIDVLYEGKQVGAVLLCCGWQERPIQAAMEHLVRSTIHQLHLEEEEEALLEELSASWESLEAVYEISSDLRSLQNPRDLLDRILRRAISIQEGLQAVLWLEEGGRLEPIITTDTLKVEPRDKTQGLIGKALAEHSSIVLNGRSRLAAVKGLEPELRGAASVAIAPISTRRGLLGALAVWQEHGRSEFDSRTMRLVEALALQAAMVVENDRLYRAAIESERLRQEVEIGSKIQQMLLLGQSPQDLCGLSVAALTIPSRQIDGDFYEFVKHNDQCLDILIGDVMGKGIPAALIGAATKSHFLRAISQLISSSRRNELPEPEEIVALVHAQVTRQLIDLESFVTLCYARFDLESRRLTFVDCGHTRTIHLQHRTGACNMLRGDNMPLGFSERETYAQVTTLFGAGDIFCFYSDGLTEARNLSGELFGQDRLIELIQTHQQLAPEELISKIHQAVVAFSDSETFADDLTCVAVKIDNSEKTAPIARAELTVSSHLSELQRIREFVRQVGQGHSPTLDEESTSQLELAVNEAASNIMIHAYHGRADQRIQLEADVFADRIVIRLYDWGEAFDPQMAKPPAFDGSREGGFGLYLIAHSVDEVRYSRDESGRNCISLIKKRSRP